MNSSCCRTTHPFDSIIPLPMSQSAARCQRSQASQFFNLAGRPGVISFGGGLPTAEGFPVDAIRAAADWVLEKEAERALQYSASAGEPELREALARWEAQKGVPTKAENIIICSGSQQGLDLIGNLFLDPGAKFLIERPTYMGALEAFELRGPNYVTLPSDEFGLNPDMMGEECRGARLAYVMPTFQNPTGLTISAERRRKLAEKAREYDFWIFEDNPYGELYYDEEPPLSMRAFAPERTITLNTMSKVLSPGLRPGYFLAPKHVIDVMERLKFALDLHTSTFTQLLTARCLEKGLMENHLPEVRQIYKMHAEVMLEALEESMPKHSEIRWTKPRGGMFIWLTLPKSIDAVELLERCLEAPEPVAFFPGIAFYATEKESNTVRLSFVTVTPERIRTGIRTIAECLESMLKA